MIFETAQVRIRLRQCRCRTSRPITSTCEATGRRQRRKPDQADGHHTTRSASGDDSAKPVGASVNIPIIAEKNVSWSRLSGQRICNDEWLVCRGAAIRAGQRGDGSLIGHHTITVVRCILDSCEGERHLSRPSKLYITLHWRKTPATAPSYIEIVGGRQTPRHRPGQLPEKLNEGVMTWLMNRTPRKQVGFKKATAR